jgi:uncharacterized protein
MSGEIAAQQADGGFRVPAAKPSVPQSLLVSAVALLLILFVGLSSSSAAEITIRDPGTFVVDQSGRIDSATKDRLEKLLKDLENKTSAQIKVLVVDTTGGQEIFDFAQRHALLWRLGQKGKDNGVLIVLAVNDRKVRIQTGKGVEGALPDSWTGTTSRAIAQRYFKNGQYSAGIEELTKLAALRVAEDAGVTLDGNPQPAANPPPVDSGWSPGLPFIIFLIVVIFIFARGSGSRRSRHRRTWGGPFFGGIGGWPSSGSSGGWTSSSGSSNWGGGGFSGGFGGGGSFGGGGDFGGGGGGASW